MSLRFKTILGIASIELLLLVILIVQSLWFLRDSSRQMLTKRAALSARLFASSATDAVIATDLTTLEMLVVDALESPDVTYIRVVGRRGTLAEGGDPAALARTFQRDDSAAAVDDGTLDTAVDIRVAGRWFGRVEMGFPSAEVDSAVDRATPRIIAIAALEIVLVAVFSFLLGTYLLRRLARLERAARTIADGDGPGLQVAVSGDDELARTARTFNQMSTTLRATHAQLDQARAHAEAASHAKSRFLAVMSHEIRTPLTGVLGTVDLLAQTRLDDEQRALVEASASASRALMTLINDILDYTKIEEGRLELRSANFSVADLVADVIDALAPIARGKGLALHTRGEAPTRLRGDPDRLRQVLLNLLGNAIKFTDTGSVTVTVSADELADGRISLAFEVTDTGIGIDPSEVARLFEEFTQADDSNSRRFTGTGLGLAISRRLVETMGGTIGARSEKGRGSTFRFTATVARAPARPDTAPIASSAAEGVPADWQNLSESARIRHLATGAPEPSASAPAPADLRILVAEDNPINQMVVRTMLADAGYRVDVVDNGREALTAMTEERYHLVLMDMAMPHMDGLEATRQIRQVDGPGAEVAIVALTANAFSDELNRCIDAGMDGYLTKPVPRERLLATVRRFAR